MSWADFLPAERFFMDEKYIRKRVSQIYSLSYGGGMIDMFTALIVELLNEVPAQQSVQRTCPNCCGEKYVESLDGTRVNCEVCGGTGQSR